MSSEPSTAGAPSLKHRVLGAAAWSMAGFTMNTVIRLASNLLMTRLLLPEMYGIMAVASVVLFGLAMFSDMGLQTSVIQSRRGNSAVFLNTIWIVQIVRGLIVCVVTVLISRFVIFLREFDFFAPGSVYHDPSLPTVLAALSINPLISGFESTKIMEASRRLALSRLTGMEISAQAISLITMLVCAAYERSIWVLVAGGIAASLTRTILSYLLLPGYKNRLEWDWTAFHETFQLGRWIFLSSTLFFFASNGDRILLGGLTTSSVLGAYSIAFLFFGTLDGVLSRLITDVSFPALGEVHRDRPTDLKKSYYRIHNIVASFTYACAGFLWSAGHVVIDVLYDFRYHMAGPTLQILAVALLTLPFRAATQSFLLFGQARLYFIINATRAISLFCALPLGFYVAGYPGAVWGVVLSYFASLPLIIYYSLRMGFLDLRREALLLPCIVLGVIGGEIANVLLAHTI